MLPIAIDANGGDRSPADIVEGARIVYGYSMANRGVPFSASLSTILLQEDEGGGTKLTFHTDASGRVETMTLPFEPTLDPLVFTRATREATPAELARYAGTYRLATQRLTVAVQGKTTTSRPRWRRLRRILNLVP